MWRENSRGADYKSLSPDKGGWREEKERGLGDDPAEGGKSSMMSTPLSSVAY